jgi:hypothetical protein
LEGVTHNGHPTNEKLRIEKKVFFNSTEKHFKEIAGAILTEEKLL